MNENRHYRALMSIGANYKPLTKKDFKDIRKLYGLSQRSFADMLDINVRTLQHYELGERKPSQTVVALMNFARNDVPYFKQFLKENPSPYCYFRNAEYKN